jgi:hypothetical protein
MYASHINNHTHQTHTRIHAHLAHNQTFNRFEVFKKRITADAEKFAQETISKAKVLI